MATNPTPQPWTRWLGMGLAAGVVAMALAQAVRSGGEDPVEPHSMESPVLTVHEPITQLNARFLAAGWTPDPEQPPLPFERKLAGNNLASLSACSGTGQGFCRYDYRRGNRHVAVVTVPGATGDGVVHNWSNLD